MSNYHITDDQVQVESFGQLLETGLRDEFRPAIPAVIWLFRAWLESADLRPAAQPAPVAVELPKLDDECAAALSWFIPHLELLGSGQWYANSPNVADDGGFRKATINDAKTLARLWLPRLKAAERVMTKFLCDYEGTGADIGARRRAMAQKSTIAAASQPVSKPVQRRTE